MKRGHLGLAFTLLAAFAVKDLVVMRLSGNPGVREALGAVIALAVGTGMLLLLLKVAECRSADRR